MIEKIRKGKLKMEKQLDIFDKTDKKEKKLMIKDKKNRK
jgi:hypothetical protein